MGAVRMQHGFKNNTTNRRRLGRQLHSYDQSRKELSLPLRRASGETLGFEGNSLTEKHTPMSKTQVEKNVSHEQM